MPLSPLDPRAESETQPKSTNEEAPKKEPKPQSPTIKPPTFDDIDTPDEERKTSEMLKRRPSDALNKEKMEQLHDDDDLRMAATGKDEEEEDDMGFGGVMKTVSAEEEMDMAVQMVCDKHKMPVVFASKE